MARIRLEKFSSENGKIRKRESQVIGGLRNVSWRIESQKEFDVLRCLDKRISRANKKCQTYIGKYYYLDRPRTGPIMDFQVEPPS
jgi:hypothetical protein